MKTVMTIFIIMLTIQIPVFSSAESVKDEPAWPRKLDTGPAVISVYQPQINALEGDMLDARAAVSVKEQGEDLVFGAIWFKSRIATDVDARLVDLEDLEIVSVRFPDAEEDREQDITALLEREIPGMNMTFSLDRFLTSLEMVEKSQELSGQLHNNPPNIYYEDEPAVLVVIDGDPILEDIENTGLQYVANTPYFIIYNPADMFFYLKGGRWWYRAGRVEDTWREIDNPPGSIRDIAEQLEGTYDTDVDSIARTMEYPPKIVLSREPSELIITDGEPDFAALKGTRLLYVRNTESEILMDINTQEYYVLISGRWYKSKSLDRNDWVFVSPDNLPEDFALIEAESEMGSVRSSVPGTREAREALLENEIPQTAVIDRNNTDLSVEYDGKPEFENISSTGMSYAVNTDKSVLLINGSYYAVDNAVWYISDYPGGPWRVCVEVPAAVQVIPPSCPVYNVKYVYVYDYTPDVVYVGYTPGYIHSYRYRGIIVYGTGYHYRPWYRTFYYPRPLTFGFGVHYNPYSGWGYSVGISYGWVGYSYYRPWYHTSWWGPAGYLYGYRHGYYSGFGRAYYRGYYRGYGYGVYTSSRSGYTAGFMDGYHYAASNNVYRRSRSRAVISTGTRPVTYGSRTNADSPGSSYSRPGTTDRKNNVYTDMDGNIYRERRDTWQQRQDGTWRKSELPAPSGESAQRTQNRSSIQERTSSTSSSSERTATGTTRRTTTTVSRLISAGSSLVRESKARSQGSQRTFNYQQSREPDKKSVSTRNKSTSRSSQAQKNVSRSRSGSSTEQSGERTQRRNR